METGLTKQKNEKSNIIYWILGGVGLLAVILLSSFKSTATEVSTDTLSDCKTNPECFKGFWRWYITKYLYGDMVKRATEKGITVMAQVDATANWNIDQKTPVVPASWSEYLSDVGNETTIVKAQFPSLTYDLARVKAIDNIVNKLLK